MQFVVPTREHSALQRGGLQRGTPTTSDMCVCCLSASFISCLCVQFYSVSFFAVKTRLAPGHPQPPIPPPPMLPAPTTSPAAATPNAPALAAARCKLPFGTNVRFVDTPTCRHHPPSCSVFRQYTACVSCFPFTPTPVRLACPAKPALQTVCLPYLIEPSPCTLCTLSPHTLKYIT